LKAGSRSNGVRALPQPEGKGKIAGLQKKSEPDAMEVLFGEAQPFFVYQ
jgi:hypothetical protein